MLCILPVHSIAYSTRSAERIELAYSLFTDSIPIRFLRTYADTGEIDSTFAVYVHTIDSNQLAELRQLLLTKIPLSAIAVSQFLYTPIGEKLLMRLEQVIQIEGQASGFQALRSAMILAARNSDGFTLSGVLQQLPSQTARFKLSKVLSLAQEAKQFTNQTQDAIAAINQQATLEIQSSTNLLNFEDLRQPGKLTWQKQTIVLNDSSRDRQISTDIYLPRSNTPHPVVVISHGLGGDRNNFAYLAKHLASYGFAVVVPDHPGSNSKQLAALLSGKTSDVTPPQEFVDRPTDISRLLNRLEQLSHSDSRFQGQLNLQNVGIVGHSFGGYTAFALAGATLHPQHLQARCQAAPSSLNLSLLLQCEALRVPQLPSTLADPRIKAVIAINPFSSAIFGQAGLSQIKVPTLIVGGSADTIAPTLSEQIQPFTWLTTRHKYLALTTGGTHFSALSSSPNDAVPIPPSAFGTDPVLARQYTDALSAAFFKTHLMHQQQYQPYLSANYAKSISRASMSIALTKTFGVNRDRSLAYSTTD